MLRTSWEDVDPSEIPFDRTLTDLASPWLNVPGEGRRDLVHLLNSIWDDPEEEIL